MVEKVEGDLISVRNNWWREVENLDLALPGQDVVDEYRRRA